MRICHVNLSKELRGGERQTLALMHALPPSVRQRIVVRGGSRLHQALKAEPVLPAEIAPVSNSPIAASRATANVDLVHVHDGRGVLAGALRSLLGTPFVVTRRVAKAPTDRAGTRWSYSRARCIVGVSQAVTSLMKAYDPNFATRIIHDCVPALRAPSGSEVAAIRERFAGRILIGQVGQLDDAAKGQRLTLAAARRFESLLPKVLFLMIGEGRDEAALKAEAASSANVVFTGWTDSIESYYAALDVLVLPSHSEGLGSSILEAMSFGVPVVASAVDGIPEIVRPGKNGLLFEDAAVESLAAQLALIAEDGELRRELGRQACGTAAEFSAERMAGQYLELYRELLDTTATGSVADSSGPHQRPT